MKHESWSNPILISSCHQKMTENLLLLNQSLSKIINDYHENLSKKDQANISQYLMDFIITILELEIDDFSMVIMQQHLKRYIELALILNLSIGRIGLCNAVMKTIQGEYSFFLKHRNNSNEICIVLLNITHLFEQNRGYQELNRWLQQYSLLIQPEDLDDFLLIHQYVSHINKFFMREHIYLTRFPSKKSPVIFLEQAYNEPHVLYTLLFVLHEYRKLLSEEISDETKEYFLKCTQEFEMIFTGHLISVDYQLKKTGTTTSIRQEIVVAFVDLIVSINNDNLTYIISEQFIDALINIASISESMVDIIISTIIPMNFDNPNNNIFILHLMTQMFAKEFQNKQNQVDLLTLEKSPNRKIYINFNSFFLRFKLFTEIMLLPPSNGLSEENKIIAIRQYYQLFTNDIINRQFDLTAILKNIEQNPFLKEGLLDIFKEITAYFTIEKIKLIIQLFTDFNEHIGSDVTCDKIKTKLLAVTTTILTAIPRLAPSVAISVVSEIEETSKSKSLKC
jgi:hypothetical protein